METILEMKNSNLFDKQRKKQRAKQGNESYDEILNAIKTDEEAWIKREEKKLKFIKKHKLKLFLFICLIDIPIILISFLTSPETFEKWLILLGFFATLFSLQLESLKEHPSQNDSTINRIALLRTTGIFITNIIIFIISLIM